MGKKILGYFRHTHYNAEDQIKEKYGDTYMGGGGHAGAVSFRVQPQDEKKFLAKVNKVFDFVKDNFN